MKVAYLLVTTAWLVGADVPGQPGGAKTTPVPVTGAPVTMSGDCGSCGSCGSCNSCNTCDDCGGGWGHKFKSFCGKLFSRGDSCGCDTCGGGHHGHTQGCCGATAPTCNTCNSCNSCNDCGSGGWGHKFKSFCGKLFSRGGDCDSCNSGCGGCANGGCGSNYGATYGPGGVIVSPKGAEQIPPPKEDPAKKMPGGPGGNPGTGEPPQKGVQIINPTNPVPVTTPTLDAPPGIVPVRPDLDNRERPF